MAGAKLYRPKDFLKTDPEYLLSRVPVTMQRPESYAKEQYEENGYRAAFEALEGITKKPKSAARQQKQGAVARKKQEIIVLIQEFCTSNATHLVHASSFEC